MPAHCYAETLGDCEGKLELEHFVSNSIQQLIGPVTIAGFGWQKGAPRYMAPGTYARSRRICEAHHDRLDGLDGHALAYFRNLMVLGGGMHVGENRPGRREDLTLSIDGRGLERWFLKTVCGAIASNSLGRPAAIPARWVEILFGGESWPDEFALYVETGFRQIRVEDGRLALEFAWTEDGQLNGLMIPAFGVLSVFSIQVPDNVPPNWIRRPRILGTRGLRRPDGSDPLIGLPSGEDVEFELRWP